LLIVLLFKLSLLSSENHYKKGKEEKIRLAIMSDSNNCEHDVKLVKSWNIGTMARDASMVVLGQRDCGKTSLFKEIYNAMKFDECDIWNPNQTSMESYRDLGIQADNKTQVVIHPDMVFFEKFYGDSTKAGGAKVRGLILDGVCGHIKPDTLRRLFLNNRHMKTWIGMTVPCVTMISHVISSNVDYVVVFACSPSEQQKIYNKFGHAFKSFRQFTSVFKACTMEKGQCMVIDIASRQVFFHQTQPAENKRGAPSQSLHQLTDDTSTRTDNLLFENIRKIPTAWKVIIMILTLAVLKEWKRKKEKLPKARSLHFFTSMNIQKLRYLLKTYPSKLPRKRNASKTIFPENRTKEERSSYHSRKIDRCR
jgi:hypothetical protein